MKEYNMVRLQYVGQSHYRVISAKDLKALGFEDAEKIDLQREDLEGDVDKGLSSVAEVSQEIADFLVKREKGEWKILAEGEGPAPDATPDQVKLDQSGTELVVGAPTAAGVPLGGATPDATPESPKTTAQKSTGR